MVCFVNQQHLGNHFARTPLPRHLNSPVPKRPEPPALEVASPANPVPLPVFAPFGPSPPSQSSNKLKTIKNCRWGFQWKEKLRRQDLLPLWLRGQAAGSLAMSSRFQVTLLGRQADGLGVPAAGHFGSRSDGWKAVSCDCWGRNCLSPVRNTHLPKCCYVPETILLSSRIPGKHERCLKEAVPRGFDE